MTYAPPFWLFWVLLALAIIIAVWLTVRDVRKQYKTRESENTVLLSNLKDTLISMDTIQRETASKYTWKKNKKLADQIYSDFKLLYGDSVMFLSHLIEKVIVGRDLDYLINFFQKNADVLDKNNSGLKQTLSANTAYSKYEEQLAQTRSRLILSKAKREIVRINVERICRTIYGINSSIMFRNFVKSFPRSKGDDASQMMIVLESAESELRATLGKMLDDIEIKWHVTPLESQQQKLVDSVLGMFEDGKHT